MPLWQPWNLQMEAHDSTMQIPGLYVYLKSFWSATHVEFSMAISPQKIYPQNVEGFPRVFWVFSFSERPGQGSLYPDDRERNHHSYLSRKGAPSPWMNHGCTAKKKCCAHVYRPKLSECQWNVWFFFLKWWLSPTTRKKHPTKNHQHFGVEIGETHHFRKHPLLPYQTFLLRAENGKFHGGIRNTKKQRTRRVWKINQRAYKTNALQRSQPKSKRNISSTWRGEWC